MRKWITLSLLCLGLAASAQKEDDIVYYEDSRVKNSRFSIALYGNPNFVDRRLINNEVPQGGGLDLDNEDAEGTFQFNYGGQLFFRVGSALDVGTGFGIEHARYSVKGAEFYLNENNVVDTSLSQRVSARTDVRMKVVPIMLNFNTRISETFGLEVIPTVKLTFIDSYETEFTTANGESFRRDFTELAKDLNYQVGLDLGGTYYFGEKLGFFLRFNASYLLNNMLELDSFPRETLFAFGSNLGFKYTF